MGHCWGDVSPCAFPANTPSNREKERLERAPLAAARSRRLHLLLDNGVEAALGILGGSSSSQAGAAGPTTPRRPATRADKESCGTRALEHRMFVAFDRHRQNCVLAADMLRQPYREQSGNLDQETADDTTRQLRRAKNAKSTPHCQRWHRATSYRCRLRGGNHTDLIS